ncbi:aryl-alcohol dehydrogenase-like predicted oxidoreductase [Catalinimonas alkaloidigena]|uniref:aldo/keto reductase n=1 Tax=Catalinimonas alkaloidigena TaxID=1075417 RepID=UPI002405AF4F|nr:aldo/keto reductase [Catalinimonas alkaloidigena]MDF9798950.1 aryl-alcohol dehydrogenase-like predicted oxidoreductase [Catalinimonas alkaloidigena]
MRKRRLGSTELEVSEVAFGGVEIGIPYGIGIASESDMITEKEAIHLLHTALDEGINFFDTARLYGKSENIMGKAFLDRRNQAVIASKCVYIKDEKGNIPDYPQLKKLIESSLDASLKALQTDYIDIYMLHQADEEIITHEGVCSIFEDLVQSGKIRAKGASVYSSEQTQTAIATGHWDMIQLPFNLMDQRQADTFSAAKEAGVGIVVRSVLFKGILSERSKNLHPALKKVEAHIKNYQSFVDDTFPDLPTLASKFALSFEEVSSILVGIDRMEYLRKSLEAADGKYMDESTLLRARAAQYPDPEFLDLPAWDRSGWLK